MYSAVNIGVSVVICCYNSAQRLPETLAHLAAQKVPDSIPWEVIVVDNASTDNTSLVARNQWPDEATAPLRVVHEPQAGLSHARVRGFSEATYEYISFVDDDNWVDPSWVTVLYDVMSRHPEVGACGGRIEAAYEVEPPAWVEEFQLAYAVNTHLDTKTGDVTATRGRLEGAGMTIRKAAWADLQKAGFKSMLHGRKGKALTSGEDTEICYALRLGGWRLWHDDRLHMQHYMPASRLTWSYLRRLSRGMGSSHILLTAYGCALTGVRKRPGSWIEASLRILRALIWQRKSLWDYLEGGEGNKDVLQIEKKRGSLMTLLKWRSKYDATFSRVEVLRARLQAVPKKQGDGVLSAGAASCETT